MSNLLLNFDSIVRDLKILSILGEFYIEPDIKSLKMGSNILFHTNHWKIIQKFKKDTIVTGSCALKAFNLIERSPKDVDFILTDESNLNRYCQEIYEKNTRDGYLTIDVIGSTLEKETRIDFFKFTDQSIIEVDGVKFHNPLEILTCKRNTIESLNSSSYVNRRNSKHFEDIFFALKKIMPEKLKLEYSKHLFSYL
jgi:hypothetical protein